MYDSIVLKLNMRREKQGHQKKRKLRQRERVDDERHLRALANSATHPSTIYTCRQVHEESRGPWSTRIVSAMGGACAGRQ